MARPRMTKLEMVAESLREIGVLVLVFGFLDLMTGQIKGTSAVTAHWIVLIVAVTFGMGMLFERIREEK